MPSTKKIWEEIDDQLKFLSLIASGESETVEFKTIADPKISSTVARLISGFANNEGGLIIFGVTDNSELVGINSDAFDKMLEVAHSYLVGDVILSQKIVQVSNKKFGIIKVEKSAEIPLATRQGYFVRKGSATQLMSPNDLSKITKTSNQDRLLNSLILTIEQQSLLIEDLNVKFDKANSLSLKFLIAIISAGFGALSNQILNALDIHSLIQMLIQQNSM